MRECFHIQSAERWIGLDFEGEIAMQPTHYKFGIKFNAPESHCYMMWHGNCVTQFSYYSIWVKCVASLAQIDQWDEKLITPHRNVRRFHFHMLMLLYTVTYNQPRLPTAIPNDRFLRRYYLRAHLKFSISYSRSDTLPVCSSPASMFRSVYAVLVARKKCVYLNGIWSICSYTHSHESLVNGTHFKTA